MQTTTIPIGSTEVVTLGPEDNSNPPNPAAFRAGAVPTWISSDPTICTVTPSASGLSATLASLAGGNVSIAVQAVSDFNGGTQLNNNLQVVVPPNPATQFTFILGPVVA